MKKSIIMPGACIGNNVITGVGLVVSENIESNSINIRYPANKISESDNKAKIWSKIQTNLKKD